MKADIEGLVRSLNISENNFLVPVFEAVVNGIQSIHEHKAQASENKGQIKIIIERDKTQTDVYSEAEEGVKVNYPISKIKIIDNGVGFNQSNFDSFNRAHSTKKIKIGGKGIGRFAMLSVFNRVDIESTFKRGDSFYKRIIPFGKKYNESKSQEFLLEEAKETGTTITLADMNKKFVKISRIMSQEQIAQEILRHCLLYYINEEAPEIIIVEDNLGDINLSRSFDPKKFILNKYENELVKGKQFNFYITKIEQESFNLYSYTADNRVVETKRINSILPVFKSKIEENEQEYYIGIYITSDFLDERVHPNRLSIRFDKSDKDSESNFDTITEKEVEEKLIEIVGREFAETLKVRGEANRNKVDEFLRDEGIGYRWLDFDDDFLQSIPDDADNKKLDDLFHTLEYNAKRNLSSKKHKLLSKDYSNRKEYRELLNDVVESISKESESRLAQYVSHRKVIIDLLGKYLEWQRVQEKYKEESALHNLFFTMGGTEKDIPHSRHNLWLIDERLAYFSLIRSDIAQKAHQVGKTASLKRPDIALYDTSFKYGDYDTSDEVHTIVFVEFKRPHRDDLLFTSYNKQMIDQVKGIEDGLEDYNGAYVNISPHKIIYYYYICDIKDFNRIKDDAVGFGSFNLSPYGTLIRFQNNRVEEIMTYQQVKTSAIQRNMSFFKNLGIE